MGIASFVVGLTCLVLTPFLNVLLILPAILALVLGIIDVVIKSKKKESRGLAIAGIVLSAIALVACILITVFAVAIFNTAGDAITNSLDSLSEELENSIKESRCKVGESATLDNMRVSLVSVDKDFDDYYSFAMVDDACKILQANFEFENTGDYSKYVSYSNFECFADKFSCDSFYSVEGAYFYETIEDGKKAKGTVYFEVPKDAKTVEIEYTNNYSDDSKIIFEID